ncbi:dCTP deaminase [Trichococcus pasteurii]|uniref:Deoxyuridine triphosphate nucleotidohydrolase/deoxycytidine triphosphate deaminase n=1 Tax=Trichococcus pasteurii TaxID=43064 RepID=A0A1W1IJL7_9LACT|nr:hypothetical protein [Trichococcus pasteurii]SFF03732.1 deoxycytidine triphosphate deaminase [Trichococcus pasteurii]SLM53238.1 deoxyuridine triphosphate nucleotidohydrolase/deoxycytidine triphosphate deaminase [Trichococcus pasteurii]SSB94119.1 deoxyuridine triphosphate nucleotidohydrolase/deoxycytidine triphosphate deaminase [Trichococcus pasteurii]
MYLADNHILKLIEDSKVIEPFDKKKLGASGYDLTIESIILPDKKEEVDKYDLNAGQIVFVSSEEILTMPNDHVGLIVQRNSSIRLGLAVAGPVYQPGHRTKVFLRVTNLSSNTITLSKGESVASIMFEKLSCEPSKPYDGTFSDEFSYSGIGDYHDIKLPSLSTLEKK